MAHNPHGQAPEPEYDPAGNTQMFRAFVDEGASQGPRQSVPQPSSGPRLGLIAGVLVAVAVLAGLVWIAVG